MRSYLFGTVALIGLAVVLWACPQLPTLSRPHDAGQDSSASFSDVPSDHPFFEEIEWAAEQGFVDACSTSGQPRFCPDDPTTRGGMAVALYRMLYPAWSPASQPYFDDVGSGHPAFQEIQTLLEKGVTKSCRGSPGNFCPESPLIRAAAAVVLGRAIYGEQPMCGPESCADTDPHFRDVDQAHWGFPFVQKLFEVDVIGGCTSDYYCPEDTTSRGEWAAYLHRTWLVNR